jgi:hypothetical protein
MNYQLSASNLGTRLQIHQNNAITTLDFDRNTWSKSSLSHHLIVWQVMTPVILLMFRQQIIDIR